MPTWVYVAGAGVLLLIVIGVPVLVHRRRSKQRNVVVDEGPTVHDQLAELEELMAQASGGDQTAYTALHPQSYNSYGHGPWWSFVCNQHDDNLRQRFEEAVAAGRRQIAFNERIGSLRRLLAASLEGERESRIDAYIDLIRTLKSATPNHSGVRGLMAYLEQALGITTAEATEQLNRLLNDELTYLVMRAKTGSRGAFVDAETLISATEDSTYGTRFYETGIASLSKPDGWDELVVRYWARPVWSQFRDDNKPKTELVYVAAEAVAERSLVKAQRVLAACAALPEVRRLIGDVRHAQLADVVVALQMASVNRRTA